MSKTKISEYSATANSNTDVGGINIDEGCAPSGINDAIRTLMAQLKNFQTGTGGDSFNGPIGSTTPAAGAFTTLSATGNVTLGDASTDTLNVGNGGLVKDASGNVGIGNASPTYKLDVADNGTGSATVARFYRANGADLAWLSFEVDPDSNTVKYRATGSSSASHTWYTGNDLRMTLDTSGNLGLGVTPSGSWGGGKAFVNNAGYMQAFSSTELDIGSNAYYNGSLHKYSADGLAALYRQNAGTHKFYTAPTGVAGNTATFTQAMTLDASGNLGIGNTAPASVIDIQRSTATTNATGGIFTIRTGCSGTAAAGLGSYINFLTENSNGTQYETAYIGAATESSTAADKDGYIFFSTASNSSNPTERMRIDSSGTLVVGETAAFSATSSTATGFEALQTGETLAYASGAAALVVGRQTSDGELVQFRQAGTQEGSISVSGTTVSYNGGHLARFAQTIGAKDESLVKGTVLSNLDEMSVYINSEGNQVANEQLNKVKVSDVEGDANVAGVFVNWSHDDDHNVDEINMAMTGDMIIRIAQGTTVQRGDLLMSAGDGTAKPQGDDIVRAKTVAKVTSTYVTCTYEDGSYCVPCVLMAC